MQIKIQLWNKSHKGVFSLRLLHFYNQAVLIHSCKCWQSVNELHFNLLKCKFSVSLNQIPTLEVWNMMSHKVKNDFFAML